MTADATAGEITHYYILRLSNSGFTLEECVRMLTQEIRHQRELANTGIEVQKHTEIAVGLSKFRDQLFDIHNGGQDWQSRLVKGTGYRAID